MLLRNAFNISRCVRCNTAGELLLIEIYVFCIGTQCFAFEVLSHISIKQSYLQVVASSMVLSAALSLQLQYRPFLHDEHNRLESIGLHMCLLQLLVALLCNAVGKIDNNTLGLFSTIVLITVMFVSSIGFFWWTARVTMQNSHDTVGCVGYVARRSNRYCGGASRKNGNTENASRTQIVPSPQPTGPVLKKRLSLSMSHVKKVLVRSSVLKIKEKHDKGVEIFLRDIAVRQKHAGQRMQQRLLARSKSRSQKNKVSSASGTQSAVSNIAGDPHVEVIRKCLYAVLLTPKRLKKVMKKLNKKNTTTGLCKEQFVRFVTLCVNKKNKENDEKIKIKLTTIDAMWVLIRPMQVNDREEISAELLGAWLFSKD